MKGRGGQAKRVRSESRFKNNNLSVGYSNSNSHRADGAGRWTEQLWRDQHIPVNGRLDVLAVPHDEAEFICSVVAFGAAGAVAAVVAAGLGDADVAREEGRVAALIDHARADESRGRGG